MTIYIFVARCPRCDRPFESSENFDSAMELTKTHVAGQHPDHDPLWYETYPYPVASGFDTTGKGVTQ